MWAGVGRRGKKRTGGAHIFCTRLHGEMSMLWPRLRRPRATAACCIVHRRAIRAWSVPSVTLDELRTTGNKGEEEQAGKVTGAQIRSPLPYVGPVHRGSQQRNAGTNDQQHQEICTMRELVLAGRELSAWQLFNDILKRDGKTTPRASIWHWEIMVGLAARDSTVPIGEVLDMACVSERYESSVVYRSLEGPTRAGGPVNQQRVLACALIRNLGKRKTAAAYDAALSVWHTFLRQGGQPNIRLVTAACVTMVRMNRKEEAIQTLLRWTQPTDAVQERGKMQADGYTVTELMLALLDVKLPQSAFSIYKVGTGELYGVPTDNIMLNLLLWAAKMVYEGQLDKESNLNEEGHFEYVWPDEERRHWKAQATWDEAPAALQAQAIFKTHLFFQHPELKTVGNPLYEVTGEQSGFMWKAHAQMERWSQRLASAFPTYEGRRYPLRGPQEEGLVGQQGRPAPKERIEVGFDADVFDHYLQILPYVNMEAEVPWDEYLQVLAWMKRLDIQPTRYVLLQVCCALDHLLPPATESVHAWSAAGPLHGYIADWLGEESIPQWQDVGAFGRAQQRKWNAVSRNYFH